MLNAQPNPLARSYSMDNQRKKPISIVAFGMDKQTRSILEMVFRGPGKGNYVLVEQIESAQACIFDLDNFEGQNFWKDYRIRFPLPAVILSIEHKEVAGTVYVKKPIEIDKFIKGIDKLKRLVEEVPKPAQKVVTKSPSQLSPVDAKLATEIALEKDEETLHQFCGILQDIDPDNPKDVEKAYYDPSQYMQGFFEKAIEVSQKAANKGLLLEGLYTPMVLVYKNNKIFCDSRSANDLLRTMALLPVAKSGLHITFLNENEVKKYAAVNHLTALPFDHFFWQVTLWTARGRVPKGIDLNKDIVLLSWPNFTRLIVTPHALKISALWREQPHSLLETAKILEIPQRCVFAFFSAAYASKLAFPERRTKQRKLPKGQKDRRFKSNLINSNLNRGLLQRLLARLHSGKSHEKL